MAHASNGTPRRRSTAAAGRVDRTIDVDSGAGRGTGGEHPEPGPDQTPMVARAVNPGTAAARAWTVGQSRASLATVITMPTPMTAAAAGSAGDDS
jgi:hypothetical protein